MSYFLCLSPSELHVLYTSASTVCILGRPRLLLCLPMCTKSNSTALKNEHWILRSVWKGPIQTAYWKTRTTTQKPQYYLEFLLVTQEKKTKCWKKEDRNGNDTQQTEEPGPWFLMKKECRKITASLNVAQLQSWSRKRGQEQGRNKRGK